MRLHNLYLILVLLLCSCEEPIDKSLNTVDSDLLVVEAVLTNEKINHKIILSHPYQSINGSPAPATGATIYIIEGNSVVYNAVEYPLGSGVYYTEELIAVFGKPYTLLIQYQGKNFTAQSGSVPVEPLPPFQYERAAEDYYRLIITDSGSDSNYVDYMVTWINTSFCQTGELCNGRVVHYDLKTIDVNELFKPDQKDFVFPEGSIVIRKKYSVSPDYKSYLRSVLSETAWRGGVFDVQRSNPVSNLSNGAIGYFAVASVVSDTTIIVKKP